MSYQPKQEMLQAYVAGELDAANSFAIAAHLELSSSSREHVMHLERLAGLDLQNQIVEQDFDFGDMFDQIVALDPQQDITVKEPKSASVEVNGRTFQLPRSMSRIASQIGDWRSYGGKVFSANIDLGEEAKVNLLYIAEDVSIPQHTHKGLETTLVLHGNFSDEEGEYHQGDFVVKDASDKHSPQTSMDDCLCLTVLTEPMLFTQGVARLFNMFGKGMYP
ncbi:ChrR family anti-sigma-E factor [Vibrio sp. LaRot3]|uniref:ChrR family anti-sigma-E factor n=1 Tax=Vibrio sp. LaRot3 TaxID=2998829 RepID=UPI0022CE35D7|nr:ChrR family anti-sigma-E factor [Vibrio sp. LaRot3]MDA0146795.1 ChrR family anti-sigma-E factor [Vibrio sp. LaRot3]